MFPRHPQKHDNTSYLSQTAISRVSEIKVLSSNISDTFSLTEHISTVIRSSVQTVHVKSPASWYGQ